MLGSEMGASLSALSCLKSWNTMLCVQSGRVRHWKMGSHSLLLTAFGAGSIVGEKAGRTGDWSIGDRLGGL